MKTSKHPKLDNGQPAISCFALSQEELVRRLNAAHERADRAVAAQDWPADNAEQLKAMAYAGRNELWHTEFPLGLRLMVSDTELFRLTADLPGLLVEANNGQPLDFWDYGYVADVLREELVSLQLLPGDAQNLRRALAWAEDQGSMKRDYALE